MQIADDARELGKYTGLSTVTLIGGADYAKQLSKVNDRVTDIVVATPGRLIDFIQRGDMFLDRVESLVLDEADRMLDMGFIPQVKRIVRSTPKEDRQCLVFSATFSQDIMNLAGSGRLTLSPSKSNLSESLQRMLISVSIFWRAAIDSMF